MLLGVKLEIGECFQEQIAWDIPVFPQNTQNIPPYIKIASFTHIYLKRSGKIQK